ncbi:ATP-binding cassette, subfamily B [Lachnospiraceae bacterium]|nr:ATP-binding cassette, subfamily B [Lachnospiraceae bacterium]
MIKVLTKSIREYMRSTILTPVYVALEVLLECILPFVMADLIDHMNGTSMEPVVKYGAILLVMAFASLFFGVMSGREAATASCGFAKNLRHDMFYRIQSFSFADVDKFSSSSLVTRMTTDVTNVQNAFMMVIRIAVRTPLMMIFSLIMAFSINAKLALIFAVMIPVVGFALGMVIRTAFPIFRRIFHKYDALNTSVQENVSAVRVVKAFVREGYEQEKFGKASEDVRQEFTLAERVVSLNNPFLTFGIYTSLLLLNWFGANVIISSHGSALSTGELTSLITYGVQIMISLMMFSMVVVMITIASESTERIVEVMQYEPTLVSPENGEMTVADGSIDFEHVSFRYAGNSKKKALSDIDLHIGSGETIGIIGGTGSSKTTLIQLISRLYDVTEGTVKVGGKDVKEYDLKALRDQVAVVLQKNVLFSGTIKDNLRWGKKDATDEEILHVCRLAQADEFVQLFPDKYDTWIEQGGTNVSGGQKQRLCIARALLKKPKVLILDDSTSAVDTKTDALIRRAFAEEIPDTTKIIIAQRVSSVQDADQIIVLDGGRIVEKGTHDELLKEKGIYSELYTSQTGKEA